MFLLVGLPLLFASSQTINANICPQPLTTVISAPANNSSTSDASTTMTGTTYGTSRVAIADNGTPVATVMSDDAGAFSVRLPLIAGANRLTAHITNICNVTDDANVAVTYTPVAVPPSPSPSPTPTPAPTPSAPAPSPTPPATAPGSNPVQPPPAGNPPATPSPTPLPDEPLQLNITSPATETSTRAPSLFVSGTTNQPAVITITVNGKIAAQYDTAGTSFKVRVPLDGGKNIIAVQATTSQHTVSNSVTVVRDGKQVTTITTPGSNANVAWYNTSSGKLMIATATLAIIGAIILIELFL